MDMDMDMGSSDSAMCSMSMLWNWETIDTCFLASSWHVHSKGAFAGSVIGVFALTIAIEFVRFYGRCYDRELIVLAKRRLNATNTTLSPVPTLPTIDTPASEGEPKQEPEKPSGKTEALAGSNAAQLVPIEIYPTWPQQVIRGLCYGSQFTASFIVMLFGMYFNGYILLAIFAGQTVGYCLFGRDFAAGDKEGTGSGHCC